MKMRFMFLAFVFLAVQAISAHATEREPEEKADGRKMH
jgi:hypothetical protein